MAATLAAIIKKKYDMWVWNVIWSDIFNILWIVWISSVITPLHMTPKCLIWSCDTFLWSLMYDNIFSMLILIATLVITLIFMRSWWKLSKSEWLFLFIFACLRMAFELVPHYFIGLFS
jgi:Ca2+/Na+ antiporter